MTEEETRRPSDYDYAKDFIIWLTTAMHDEPWSAKALKEFMDINVDDWDIGELINEWKWQSDFGDDEIDRAESEVYDYKTYIKVKCDIEAQRILNSRRDKEESNND